MESKHPGTCFSLSHRALITWCQVKVGGVLSARRASNCEQTVYPVLWSKYPDACLNSQLDHRNEPSHAWRQIGFTA
jgi:hypothetical protein